MSKKQYVFVYGTLKAGYNGHAQYMTRSKFVGTATVKGVLLAFDGVGYPAMVPHDLCSVHGQVFEVDDKTLEDLDRYEGVKSRLFYRKEIEVPVAGKAWAYFWGTPITLNDKTRVCADGVWTSGTMCAIPYATEILNTLKRLGLPAPKPAVETKIDASKLLLPAPSNKKPEEPPKTPNPPPIEVKMTINPKAVANGDVVIDRTIEEF